MSNKLSNIFSVSAPFFTFKMSSSDSETEKSILNAIRLAIEERKTSSIFGNIRMETFIAEGTAEYPFTNFNNISELTIEPSKTVKFTIDAESGEQDLLFYTDSFYLETPSNSIIYLKLNLKPDEEKLTLTFDAHPENAKTIFDIVRYYEAMLIFLEKILSTENNNEERTDDNGKNNFDIEEIFCYLRRNSARCKRILSLEKSLNISFIPSEISNDESSWADMEELYILLIFQKALRLNARLKITDETGMILGQKINETTSGQIYDLTYISESEYNLWGHKVNIYLSNLLGNAVVKEIINLDDGKQKILFTEDSDNPMYISYTGFLTKDEAKVEIEQAMFHKDIYENAETLDQHLTELMNSDSCGASAHV